MIVRADRRHGVAIDVFATLVSRARSEYLEMPGLSLTASQAARLWGTGGGVSELVLTRLMQSGFLWRTPEGAYMRRSAR
jgi:hypothetical protein